MFERAKSSPHHSAPKCPQWVEDSFDQSSAATFSLPCSHGVARPDCGEGGMYEAKIARQPIRLT